MVAISYTWENTLKYNMENNNFIHLGVVVPKRMLYQKLGKTDESPGLKTIELRLTQVMILIDDTETSVIR